MKFNIGQIVATMEHGVHEAVGIVTAVDGELHKVVKFGASDVPQLLTDVLGVVDAAAAAVPEAAAHGTHVIYPLPAPVAADAPAAAAPVA